MLNRIVKVKRNPVIKSDTVVKLLCVSVCVSVQHVWLLLHIFNSVSIMNVTTTSFFFRMYTDQYTRERAMTAM